MKWFRVCALIWVFCVDVHVKAEEAHESGCWGNRVPCAFKAEEARTVLKLQDTVLSLSRHALVQRRQDSVALVQGEFYIETSKPIHFQSPYGKFWCTDDCKGLVVRNPERINLKNLEGQWHVQRTGEAQEYVLPVGLQVSLGEVNDRGQATMDFPQSVPWNSTVHQWAELFPESFEELKPAIVKFRSNWREAVDAVSELHQHEAQRSIASHEQDLAREKAQRLAREREDQSLRALFREKNP